jgi:lipopolysaccharide transport system ATP-binding protein
MSDWIIRAERIGKKYRIRHREQERYTALRDVFSNHVRNAFTFFSNTRNKTTLETFDALHNISFDIRPGEVVGIIGKNGAGKSTLLKILSRITEPTEGRITLRGRVASLLEVGTGFHPELTGRENIFLNGAILGMRRAEIRASFDSIVAFAEIERFLDTPVKRYSSGMYVRLAFAVAAHLSSEILIIDEVLAVGDANFQKRCLGRMGEVAKSGRTVLFVSHNMPTVASLCSRALLIDSGTIIQDGSSATIVSSYIRSGILLQTEKRYPPGSRLHQRTDGKVELRQVRLLDENRNPLNQPHIDQRFFIEITYEILQQPLQPVPIVHFSSMSGERILASLMPVQQAPSKPGIHVHLLTIPPNTLNNIGYRIMIHIASLNPSCTHCEDHDAISFEPLDSPEAPTRSSYRGDIPGFVRPLLKWETA